MKGGGRRNGRLFLFFFSSPSACSVFPVFMIETEKTKFVVWTLQLSSVFFSSLTAERKQVDTKKSDHREKKKSKLDWISIAMKYDLHKKKETKRSSLRTLFPSPLINQIT
jgi:hypothetical protein